MEHHTWLPYEGYGKRCILYRDAVTMTVRIDHEKIDEPSVHWRKHEFMDLLIMVRRGCVNVQLKIPKLGTLDNELKQGCNLFINKGIWFRILGEEPNSDLLEFYTARPPHRIDILDYEQRTPDSFSE